MKEKELQMTKLVSQLVWKNVSTSKDESDETETRQCFSKIIITIKKINSKKHFSLFDTQIPFQ